MNEWELVTINAERATFRRQLPPLAWRCL